MTDPGTLVPLLLLGGWVALDGTSFAQVMVSRPIVSGTLAGWILGDPGTGFLLGAVLESVHLVGAPVGGARLPEPGPAGIVAVAAALHVGGVAGIACGAGLGAAWSILGGRTVGWQRRLNGVLVRGVAEGTVSARGLTLRHGACIVLDGVRGVGLTASGLAVVALLPARLAADWPLDAPSTLALLLLPSALAAGSLMQSWANSPRRGALLLFGVLGGCAVVALL